jgi:prepilin-type N-terminal cleavage/methylation domain-containing protein
VKLKRKKSEAGFTLVELIMVIVILGIISSVAIPKFINLGDSAKLSVARGVGSTITATIQAEHSDYLINATAYTMADVLAGISFTGGIKYHAHAHNTPKLGVIAPNSAGDKIGVNIKGNPFVWNWIAQVGDTPALITEDSATAFP